MTPLKDDRGDKAARYKVKFDMQKWYQENWQDHLLSEKSRYVPVSSLWDCSSNYMVWFLSKSHPRVQNPKFYTIKE